jgi:hypothetical protein
MSGKPFLVLGPVLIASSSTPPLASPDDASRLVLSPDTADFAKWEGIYERCEDCTLVWHAVSGRLQDAIPNCPSACVELLSD